jgi:ABC-type glutathione transport system ATPase component
MPLDRGRQLGRGRPKTRLDGANAGDVHADGNVLAAIGRDVVDDVRTAHRPLNESQRSTSSTAWVRTTFVTRASPRDARRRRVPQVDAAEVALACWSRFIDDSSVGPLEIHGLTKRYGNVVAVDDLSLEVPAGELFGFVGRNGAGKTTAMRIVLGVLTADAGEVRFGGTPLTFDARRRIGYLPEERGLYPKMRLGEQLAYLAELHGMPAARARMATAPGSNASVSPRALERDEIAEFRRS